ncbi:hypothetical protein GLE_0740 [Lysobacter enzymogenes]|uniref:Uncharacterized protein n=1 Tax=Lysobacter enzymogenes TaxID=69 RepID=A0A0S2DC50_LYSEN|nr:hypothetical protein GLE_0740 [Lysobacter enzymogenes]
MPAGASRRRKIVRAWRPPRGLGQRRAARRNRGDATMPATTTAAATTAGARAPTGPRAGDDAARGAILNPPWCLRRRA